MERLMESGKVLIPWAISPYGRWGGMFHRFLLGKSSMPGPSFTTRKQAEKMCQRASAFPCPANIVQAATTQWRRSKPRHQHFYGYSHTAPTPKEWALQRLGLVIDNALCLHLRDVELGRITTPEHELDEDLERESESLDRDSDFTNVHALWTGQEAMATVCPRNRGENELDRENTESPTQPVVGLTAAFMEGNRDNWPPITDNVVD